jgi:hypothetical protein
MRVMAKVNGTLSLHHMCERDKNKPLKSKTYESSSQSLQTPGHVFYGRNGNTLVVYFCTPMGSNKESMISGSAWKDTYDGVAFRNILRWHGTYRVSSMSPFVGLWTSQFDGGVSLDSLIAFLRQCG